MTAGAPSTDDPPAGRPSPRTFAVTSAAGPLPPVPVPSPGRAETRAVRCVATWIARLVTRNGW